MNMTDKVTSDLLRLEDESGISATGRVLEGVPQRKGDRGMEAPTPYDNDFQFA